MKSLRQRFYKLVSYEIKKFLSFYDQAILVDDHKDNLDHLREHLPTAKTLSIVDLHKCTQEKSKDIRKAYIFNGTFNHILDIEDYLKSCRSFLSRNDRLVVVAYNPYYRWLYWLANAMNWRKGDLPTTFLTHTTLENLVELSDFEIVKEQNVGHLLFYWFGLGQILNWILKALPLINALSLASIYVLRPKIAERSRPSLTIVIPARNERGNIENAIKRLPDLGAQIEVIFVEGHSTDGTWEEIQRVKELYGSQIAISAYKQTGKGKNDAVRLGFSKARMDLLTILDADLTMPPEKLDRFYNAWLQGKSDFINGDRLVYPMEGGAMRFLNRLGNIFFAKALSYVLDVRLGDSLCGTKLMARHDYERFVKWRKEFGDFDPFGDFELIFPAAILGLGIINVPIHYLNRTYGSTNISRFRHGAMLLKMTNIGFQRVKLGQIQ